MPPARFHDFAHLSDEYKGMGWVDLVPRAGGGLYIGGLHALNQREDLFREKNITHILSVLDFDIYEAGAFKQYKHLLIRIDDDPNENLLCHFKQSIAFIESAFRDGGAVFVHCAMGKSRSATICCAYLMHKFPGLSPEKALEQVCEGRPVCSPNPGFMEQLEVFFGMLKAKGETEAEAIYSRWSKDRFTGDWWTWERRRAAKL